MVLTHGIVSPRHADCKQFMCIFRANGAQAIAVTVIAVSPVLGQKRSILLSPPGAMMQSFTRGSLVWCPTEGSSLERKKGLAEWAEWVGAEWSCR